MADDGVYTTNAQIAVRAGLNVNATAITVAETDKYVLAVEAMINAKTRTDWSTLWAAGLNANFKAILTEASACWCAMQAIAYDMDGFTSDLDAQTRLDLLDQRFKVAMKALEDSNVRKVVIT